MFEIKTCDSMTWIPWQRREALKNFAQAHYCIDVYHTLITAPDDSDLDNCDGRNVMLFAANIMAEFLDTAKTGGITSDEVKQRFAWDKPVPDSVDAFDAEALRLPFMHVRCAGHLESGEVLGMHGIGVNFVELNSDGDERMRMVGVHEMFHMFHMEAYSYTYPEFLEDMEWTGALALCAKEATCRWYIHGESVGCSDYEGTSCANQPWASDECIVEAASSESAGPGLCFQNCGCGYPTCYLREMFAEVWNKYHEFTIPDFTSPLGGDIGMFTKERLVKEMSKTENCRLLLDFMESGNHILPLDITGDYSVSPQEPTTGTPVASPSNYCFSATTTVELENGNIASMKNLSIGDRILAKNGIYEPIYSFGHFDTSANKADFLQIRTASTLLAGALEITPNHLIFKEGNEVIAASSLKVGDKVMMGSGVTEDIVSIQKTTRTGIFAPFTPSGTIVTNGIQSSCFATIQERRSKIFLSAGGMDLPLTYHQLGLVFEAPHRLYCKFAKCSDTYNAKGMSQWVEMPLQGLEWILEQNIFASGLVFFLAFMLLIIVNFLEFIVIKINLVALVVALMIPGFRHHIVKKFCAIGSGKSAKVA